MKNLLVTVLFSLLAVPAFAQECQVFKTTGAVTAEYVGKIVLKSPSDTNRFDFIDESGISVGYAIRQPGYNRIIVEAIYNVTLGYSTLDGKIIVSTGKQQVAALASFRDRTVIFAQSNLGQLGYIKGNCGSLDIKGAGASVLLELYKL